MSQILRHTKGIVILTNYPEAALSPTVHKVLAHSPELIINNGNYGLLRLSEEGLEAVNKLLRRIRECLSRKTSQEANVTDCLHRLWSQSDPVVNLIKAQTKPHLFVQSPVLEGIVQGIVVLDKVHQMDMRTR